MPVDKSGSRIRQMFGEIAGRYDFMNHFLSGGTDIYWRWKTVRLARPENGDPILDVCTGTGDLAFAWRKKAGTETPVFATDFTHGMLKLAEKKRQQRDVVFMEADTLHLPFEDDTFQVVSVAFGLRNVASTIGGLAEMTRVCKPGGRVVVLEFSLPDNRILSRSYQWYFRNILPKMGQLLVRNRQAAYEYLPQSVSEFPNGSQLTEIMEEAGLERTMFRKLTGGIAAVYIGYKPAQSE
ncbi:bifunctional demethylmenaquinone methyltransferase/2-methoxy-6-polyprenyl-1,4-benzoquinol methylase UbiE [Fuerstiella marisgermanici]|uniref:Demethylmenaquinone methyltransferase n=1 Tax=Fuerstiella marisgermanici TaxID=1891926 RepID=A0A1P8WIZ5_9PLAN|nr:bifunctional demethylmenaquinone methyltransferase/2-methoxy-6-polyprenyl-1,4-benzoquinol methylase UbiE [Fuerstiella marisgermanici]APZ94026.1 Demethylmenaquinone methyltransferase [Fuerstiella marisgermanici]